MSISDSGHGVNAPGCKRTVETLLATSLQAASMNPWELGRCRQRRSKLRLYGWTWEVAEDQFFAIHGGLNRRGRRSRWSKVRRSGRQWRGREQSLRHLGNADVSRKPRHVEPVSDG